MKYVRTLFKKIVSFCSDLSFFESAAGTKNIRLNVVDSSLKDSSSGLGNSIDIFIGNTASTEYTSISKPLSG